MPVQSVTFRKSYWTVPRAKKWLKDHGYSSKKVDITGTQYRFRQMPPSKFKRYSVKKITSTISLVMGY